MPEVIGTHENWVRDVAFANNIGMPCETIATCSEDNTVVIRQKLEGKWIDTKLPKFRVPVWRVSWSLAGNMLAVAAADNNVYVYEEKTARKWEQIAEVNDSLSRSQESPPSS